MGLNKRHFIYIWSNIYIFSCPGCIVLILSLLSSVRQEHSWRLFNVCTDFSEHSTGWLFKNSSVRSKTRWQDVSWGIFNGLLSPCFSLDEWRVKERWEVDRRDAPTTPLDVHFHGIYKAFKSCTNVLLCPCSLLFVFISLGFWKTGERLMFNLTLDPELAADSTTICGFNVFVFFLELNSTDVGLHHWFVG